MFNVCVAPLLLSLSAGDRSEQRRHAAVLVLKELAEHAPTLFNVHVSSFLDHVWVALRDPKMVRVCCASYLAFWRAPIGPFFTSPHH